MRIATLITMAALAGGGVHADEIEKSAKRTITACMPTEADSRLYLAQATASKVFASIGVRLDWRDQRSCAPGAILISLASGKQDNSHSGDLGFALPYEGLHIQVFYEQILRAEAHMVSFVLAYVLVHEITHILQGFSRHSEQGIMKAKWDPEDFYQMAPMRLAFTEEDVSLIHLGLSTRTSRMTRSSQAR